MGKANEQAKDKPSLLNRWLNGIEKVGNKLPHPISIFAILVLFVIVLSAVCEMAGVSATGELVNRSKGVVETQTVQAVSLLNGEGLVYMLTHAITNFTGFAPLGVVLVAMFGIGLLEDSGLIGGALKSAVEVTPAKLITPMIGSTGFFRNSPVWIGFFNDVSITSLIISRVRLPIMLTVFRLMLLPFLSSKFSIFVFL